MKLARDSSTVWSPVLKTGQSESCLKLHVRAPFCSLSFLNKNSAKLEILKVTNQFLWTAPVKKIPTIS